MTLVKAAGSRKSPARSYVFSQGISSEGEAATARPIGAQAAVGASPVHGTVQTNTSVAKEEHFLDQIAALEKALANKDAERAEAIETAKTAAYDDGIAVGKKAAATRSHEALELLKVSLSQQSKALAQELESHADIGLDLASSVLRRVLGDTSETPAHVMSTAQHWKNELVTGSVLRVRVSANDFADQTALDALEAALPNTKIVPQLDLKPGACVFDLKLGTLDASIDQQLAKAEEFLNQPTSQLQAPAAS